MTNMYVGGRPDAAADSMPGYSGCVDEVRIEPDLVELKKNIASKNYAPRKMISFNLDLVSKNAQSRRDLKG